VHLLVCELRSLKFQSHNSLYGEQATG